MVDTPSLFFFHLVAVSLGAVCQHLLCMFLFLSCMCWPSPVQLLFLGLGWPSASFDAGLKPCACRRCGWPWGDLSSAVVDVQVRARTLEIKMNRCSSSTASSARGSSWNWMVKLLCRITCSATTGVSPILPSARLKQILRAQLWHQALSRSPLLRLWQHGAWLPGAAAELSAAP